MVRNKILQDHKRKGKAFIPPFTSMMGPLEEVSWIKTILPELLWIALIQDYYGHREGVELITALTRTIRQCTISKKPRLLATTSSFVQLTHEEQLCLQQKLTTQEMLKIQKALVPLIFYYPECPLKFLFSYPNAQEIPKPDINHFKVLVESLYNKRERNPMMVQATAIWIAFDSGVLKVSKDVSLAKFPEIENYPNTELSKKIAGSIRAAMHMFFIDRCYPTAAEWPKYFWNRGLKIDKCYFEGPSDE